MKGIILTAGNGTRLYPLTFLSGKQFLPIYDKPLFYYPLTTLIDAAVDDILVIAKKSDIPLFESFIGHGERFGVKISYTDQPEPLGIAHAFILAEKWIDGENCALILGDNIFCGSGMSRLTKQAAAETKNGTAAVFGYRVPDPERFGVVEFDENGRAVSIEEKPKQPKSDYCVTGLYFYDSRACEFALGLKPSARGELEITDLNRRYLEAHALEVKIMGDDYIWFDAGTFDSLTQSAVFVRDLQKNGELFGSPELAAYKNGFISKETLLESAKLFEKSPYGESLKSKALD